MNQNLILKLDLASSVDAYITVPTAQLETRKPNSKPLSDGKLEANKYAKLHYLRWSRQMKRRTEGKGRVDDTKSTSSTGRQNATRSVEPDPMLQFGGTFFKAV